MFSRNIFVFLEGKGIYSCSKCSCFYAYNSLEPFFDEKKFQLPANSSETLLTPRQVSSSNSLLSLFPML
jgi:hypothetical protein